MRNKTIEREITYLALGTLGLVDALDDTDSDGLTHVTDGETTKGRVLGESLDTHGLGRNHLDDGSVTRLDELGVGLDGLAGTAVKLLKDLRELAGNVGSVAVQNGGVTSTDLAGVVQDDDLSVERSAAHRRVVLAVTSDVTTANVLDGHVLDVETNVVTGDTLGELLVVHLHGLDFSGDVGGGEGNDHTGLEDTSLDTADGDCADTTNLVDILEGKTEGLVGGTSGRGDVVNGVLERSTTDDLLLLTVLVDGLGPALVPRSVRGDVALDVGGLRDHVVTVETGDGNEGDGVRVETDLLQEVGGLLDNLVVTGLGPLGSVHLVDGNNELPNTQGESEQSVLTGLAILGDTSLELTGTGTDDQNGAVGLRSTSNHVLDEITVTGGVCMLRY